MSGVPAPRQRRSAPTAQQALENAQRASEGRKVGRPRTYSPELCDRAVALGLKGKHWAAIARDFGVDRATLYKWSGEYPDFSDALSRARAYAQAWWEDDVQRNRKAKHYQANAVRLVMSGQFKEDYTESSQVNVSVGLEGFVSAIQDRLAPPAPSGSKEGEEPLSVVPSDVQFTPTKG